MNKIKRSSVRILATTLVGFACLQVMDANAVEALPTAEQGLSEIRISDTEVVPLPPGNWKIVNKRDWDFCSPYNRTPCRTPLPGRVFILENQDSDSSIFAMTIRHSLSSVSDERIGSRIENYCYDIADGTRDGPGYSISLKDTHGTNRGHNLHKCSYTASTSKKEISTLMKGMAIVRWVWEDIIDDMKPPSDKYGAWQRISNDIFNYNNFELYSRGYRRWSIQVWSKQQVQGREGILEAWKSMYMEALADGVFQSFFRRREPLNRSLLALDVSPQVNNVARNETENEGDSNQEIVEQERLAKAQAEKQQKSVAEQKRQEEERKEIERLAQEAAEQERVARAEAEEQLRRLAELKKQEEERKEAERLAKENAEREKVAQAAAEEQQRRLAELKKQEEERKEIERLAQEAAERERVAKAEAEAQQRRLAELKRQEEERKEAERREAVRLAQEAAEREKLAKVEAEKRQKKAEAARQVESVEAQLKRLQDTLAKLKAQQTVPETATKESSADLRQPLRQSPRHALVVGNAQYTSVGGLGNSVADAKAFAKALGGFGFQVALHTDIKDAEFKKAVLDFKARLETGSEVVFYFAGHGVQFGTANYLLPVDVGAESSDGVRQSSVELQQILNSISEKKLRFTLAVIDACRDNPFTVAAASPNGRGLKDNPKMKALLDSKGITPTNTAAVGQMVIYSASAGQQALDNLGPNDTSPNGLFTRIFLEKMNQPGIPVDSVLRQVKKEVVRLAKSVNHNQVPALYDQTVGEFFFKLE